MGTHSDVAEASNVETRGVAQASPQWGFDAYGDERCWHEGCMAQAGEPCVRYDGQQAAYVHMSRMVGVLWGHRA